MRVIFNPPAPVTLGASGCEGDIQPTGGFVGNHNVRVLSNSPAPVTLV